VTVPSGWSSTGGSGSGSAQPGRPLPTTLPGPQQT
jgi:hypothetical protein